MARLTAEQVAALAIGAGLTGERAAVAVAIARGESSWRTDARGDVGIQDGRWGPSIGLWQIRSQHVDRGTGRPRDADRLPDPAFNARAMAALSSGGTNWAPWTVWRTGSYRQWMTDARRAVAAAGGGQGSAEEIEATDASSPPLEPDSGAGGGISAVFGSLTSGAWWRRVGIGAGGVVLLGGGVAVIVAALGGPTLFRSTPVGAVADAVTEVVDS